MQNNLINTVQTAAVPTNVDYVHRFITSLSFTIITETLVLLAIILILSKYKIIKEKISLGTQIFAGFLASFATIPYVWYIFPNLFSQTMTRAQTLNLSEPFVFLVEVFVYRFVLRLGWRWCFLISFAANVASYVIGPILRAFGLWIYW